MSSKKPEPSNTDKTTGCLSIIVIIVALAFIIDQL